MRGKVSAPGCLPSPGGITPAHAGKSCPPGFPKSPPRDHPRACGEKLGMLETQGRTKGSPPRMRGKAALPHRYGPHSRITPAHAGKRYRVPCPLGSSGDHPRACGEKGLSGPCAGGGQGSPPRMRGKVCVGFPIFLTFGITPAHAGKRIRTASMNSPERDHPRACGEKEKICFLSGQAMGSPPRMRGKD